MKKRQFLFLFTYAAIILVGFALLRVLNVQPLPPDVPETKYSVIESGGETENAAEPEGHEPEEESEEESEEELAEETRDTNSYKNTKKQTEPLKGIGEENPEEVSKEKKPLKMVIASDTHYLTPELTDYGAAYEKFLWEDDGKVLDYSPQLIDAFVNEVITLMPSVVVISGDLTLNGERLNHLRFAQKLEVIQEAGIQVLVIPGNHDINNPRASEFVGEERLPVDKITAQEFGEIYDQFGYAQAADRDETSLSYLYKMDEKNWLLMLDSCQYDPVNLVGGKIRDTTYLWMEEQLEAAKEEGALVIPIAHHNLLEESRLYTFDCTVADNKRLVGMLEGGKLPVYFSGHLHLQRIKKHKFEPGVLEEDYSIHEIVSNSLAIAPLQYGVVSWDFKGGISYETVPLNVTAWAQSLSLTDPNLLEFDRYSANFLGNRVAGQIAGQIRNLPEEQIETMSSLYGSLNQAYCAGIPIDRKAVEEDQAYRLWERNLPDSPMFREMEMILRDATKNHNGLLVNEAAFDKSLLP